MARAQLGLTPARTTSACLPVARLLADAVRFQHAGDLLQAEALYRRVLKVQPKHFEALHNLGVCRHHQGDFRDALKLIDAALKSDPRSPMAHLNRGNALRELTRTEDSLVAYRRAAALAPESPDAHFNLASALEALGRNAEALSHFDRAVSLWPTDPMGHAGRGNVLQAIGRLDEAVLAYQHAIARDPDFADAHANLGGVLQRLRRYDAALERIDRALQLDPRHAASLANRGFVLLQQSQPVEALNCFDASLSIDAGNSNTWHWRGLALIQMRQAPEAVYSFERAAERAPGNTTIEFDRAVALSYLGRVHEVLAISERLLVEHPNHANLHTNRGFALTVMGRFDEALASLRRATELVPGHTAANFNMSLVELLTGDFENGLRHYEWRFEESATFLKLRKFAVPRWEGADDPAGRTIFVYAEQGLGDTLMFSRYARLLAQRAQHVILEVPAALADLLRRSLGPEIQVLAVGDPLPAFDLHAPLLSLPLGFRTTVATIPPPGPGIGADPERVQLWRARLGQHPAPALRVGLAWSGNPLHTNDFYRSIALERLAPLMLPGVQFVALQRDVKPSDQQALASMPAIVFPGQDLRDFEDSCAVVQLCDLVLSVDTSAAHLAGAMGRPAWVMLPLSPDWRWMLDRDDSPWYPSVRLFRQTALLEWDSVVRRVAAEMTELLRQRCCTVAPLPEAPLIT